MASQPARVPCPFDGTLVIDIKRQQHLGEWFWCQCTGCGARGPRMLDALTAIRTWNAAEVRKLPPKVLRERGQPKLLRVV